MKAFIIHLSKIESSLKTALEVKTKLDEYGIDNELFEGSYGHKMKDLFRKQGRKCHLHSFKGPSSCYTEEEKQGLSTPGVMGCFYSHYRLWNKCVELNEPIMIFEDDVLFVRPYYPVEFDEVLITVFGNRKKSDKYWNYFENPQGDPEAKGYWQASMPGTPGYIIKPSAAKKLIDFYDAGPSFLPSDNAIMSMVVKIQVHSHVMGRALYGDDGKKSLVRGKKDFWSAYTNE